MPVCVFGNGGVVLGGGCPGGGPFPSDGSRNGCVFLVGRGTASLLLAPASGEGPGGDDPGVGLLVWGLWRISGGRLLGDSMGDAGWGSQRRPVLVGRKTHFEAKVLGWGISFISRSSIFK